MHASRWACWKHPTTRIVGARCSAPVSASASASASLSTSASLASEQSTSPHSPFPQFDSRRAQPKTATNPRQFESAFALFNDVVGSGNSHAQSPILPVTNSEWALAGEIQALEGNPAYSLRTKLDLFEKKILPLVLESRRQPHEGSTIFHLPSSLHIATISFLKNALREKLQSQEASGSTAIARCLTKLSHRGPEVRADLVLNCCAILLEKGPASKSSAEVSSILSLLKNLSQSHKWGFKAKFDHFAVPSTMQIHFAEVGNKPGPNFISQFSNHLPPPYQRTGTAILTIASILADPALAKTRDRADAAPLLNLVEFAVRQVNDLPKAIEAEFAADIRYQIFQKERLVALKEYVVSNLDRTLAMLREDKGWRAALRAYEEGRLPTAAKTLLSRLHVAIRTKLNARNVRAIEDIWKQLKDQVGTRPEVGKALQDYPRLMNYILYVWCAKRRPDLLQQTLDMMAKLQIEPTIQTYTAMMHGWKECRAYERIELLWAKLLDSNMELDSHIWTERISALVESGRVPEAIASVGQMMRKWEQANAQDPNTSVVRPTIETINATLQGIIIRDLQAANSLLVWAAKVGIEPNIWTYNILLRQTVKSRDHEKLQEVMRSIADNKVEPDAATFTIILEELLGGLADAPVEEKVASVIQALEDIEAAGLRPNLETYGKMLYTVSKLDSSSDQAIDAIYAHMRAAGYTNSPHMVTILIERYLQDRKPDENVTEETSGITHILRDHGIKTINDGDSILWERAVSAYAVTGLVDVALRIFDDLARAERFVTSLPVLKDLLQGLLNAGEMESAKRVVDAVLKHNTAKATDGNGQRWWKARERANGERYWRHHFWHLAVDHGLLNPAQLPEIGRGELGE